MLDGSLLHPAQIFLVVDVAVTIERVLADAELLDVDSRHAGGRALRSDGDRKAGHKLYTRLPEERALMPALMAGSFSITSSCGSLAIGEFPLFCESCEFHLGRFQTSMAGPRQKRGSNADLAEHPRNLSQWHRR